MRGATGKATSTSPTVPVSCTLQARAILEEVPEVTLSTVSEKVRLPLSDPHTSQLSLVPKVEGEYIPPLAIVKIAFELTLFDFG